MTFYHITIPAPEAVEKWLDQQEPASSAHSVSFIRGRYFTIHWLGGVNMIDASGETPEALLDNLRKAIAENSPLAKLRAEAEAAGYELTPKAT